MRIPLLSAFLGLLALTAVAQPAFAYDRNHGHDEWRSRRDWHHERVWAARPVVRYYTPAYYYPQAYYSPAYYPAPVYPAPVYSVLQFRIF